MLKRSALRAALTAARRAAMAALINADGRTAHPECWAPFVRPE